MVMRSVNQIFASRSTDVGSPIQNQYVREDGDAGKVQLVKVGEKNIQEEINSYREQTDYTSLLEKMEAGDPVATVRAQTAIQPQEPLVFGDDSQEQSLRRILDSQLLARKVYNEAGGQKKLGLTFAEFLNTGEVQQILQKEAPQVVNVDASTVNAQEGVTGNEAQ